jgi:hypothetical protein
VTFFSVLESLLLIVFQIEYLPVYTPSEAEQSDPRLFADNVRLMMSEALNVATVDQKLEDGKEASGSRETVVEDVETAESDGDNIVDVKNIGYSYVDLTGNLSLVA